MNKKISFFQKGDDGGSSFSYLENKFMEIGFFIHRLADKISLGK